jgi:hypothetical protein
VWVRVSPYRGRRQNFPPRVVVIEGGGQGDKIGLTFILVIGLKNNCHAHIYKGISARLNNQRKSISLKEETL